MPAGSEMNQKSTSDATYENTPAIPAACIYVYMGVSRIDV